MTLEGFRVMPCAGWRKDLGRFSLEEVRTGLGMKHSLTEEIPILLWEPETSIGLTDGR